jgi:hypothetical protein
MSEINKIGNIQILVHPDTVNKAREGKDQKASAKRAFKEPPVIVKLTDNAPDAEPKRVNPRISEMVSDYISRIQSSKISAKFYPPFSSGGDERVKQLQGYPAFSAMIERLTIPPADDTDAEQISMEIRQALAEEKPGITSDQGKLTGLF